MITHLQSAETGARPTVPRQVWEVALRTLLLGSAYTVLYLAVSTVTEFGGSSGTTFWPAAGVTIAVLLRRPKTEWSAYVAVVWVVEFLLDLTVSGVSGVVATGWATANVVEPLIGALLLTRGSHRIDLARRGDLLRFLLFAVVVGPAIGAVIGTGSAAVAGFYGVWPALPRWFAGDAMGALVVAPILLVDPHELLRVGKRRWNLGLPLGLGVIAVLATAPWEVTWGATLPRVLIPLLVLAALKSEPAGVALSVTLVAFAVNFMTASGYGPYAQGDQIEGLLEAQAFLAATSFSALLVSALTAHLITAAEADETKNTLLRTVAHDLRGPLAAVSGLAETMQEHADKLDVAQRDEILRHIRTTSARLIGMVERMLDLDRLRRGGGIPERRLTDLDAHIADLLPVSIDSARHQIHVGTSDIVADVDPEEFDRIIENLNQNAVRHTPRGTNIWVRDDRAPGGVTLVVEDDGPGIDVALRERLFEPFTSGATSHPGAGIGLTLVAKFAERHRGRAWVEEREGGGASFHVFLATEHVSVSQNTADRP